MKVADLIAKRENAGGRYQAALQEFREAFVDLAAIDGALTGKTTEEIRSFGEFPDPIKFRHPVYAPDVDGHLPAETTEQRNRYLEGVTA